MAWTRPASVPPTVWHEFEGRKEVNGAKRKYWVKDITDDLVDEVVHHMITGFLKDEILCKYTNLLDDKGSVEEIKQMYYELLKQKVGLVCMTKGNDGKDIIAGMNCTLLALRDYDDGYTPINKIWKKIFDIVMYISKVKDVFADYNIDKYLSAMGLYVLPDFRGEGLGEEILKARYPMCRALGIPATCTVFTSFISQKVAKNAGFQEYIEVSYEDIGKVNSEWVIPRIQEHTKVCKFMVKLVN